MARGGAEGIEGQVHGWGRGSGDGNGVGDPGDHSGARGGRKLEEGCGPPPGGVPGG